MKTLLAKVLSLVAVMDMGVVALAAVVGVEAVQTTAFASLVRTLFLPMGDFLVRQPVMVVALADAVALLAIIVEVLLATPAEQR